MRLSTLRLQDAEARDYWPPAFAERFEDKDVQGRSSAEKQNFNRSKQVKF